MRPPAITNSSSILRQSAAMQKTLEAKTPGDMEHYNLAQAKALKRKQASDRASTREETQICAGTRRLVARIERWRDAVPP